MDWPTRPNTQMGLRSMDLTVVEIPVQYFVPNFHTCASQIDLPAWPRELSDEIFMTNLESAIRESVESWTLQ